mmetsp:Transcript_26678/g.91815  ORF Transcript_26678/g.91815 Transcript_26678/m.91815 type:complete len:482 (-) Transcript_26678:397-1842(-)
MSMPGSSSSSSATPRRPWPSSRRLAKDCRESMDANDAFGEANEANAALENDDLESGDRDASSCALVGTRGTSAPKESLERSDCELGCSRPICLPFSAGKCAFARKRVRLDLGESRGSETTPAASRRGRTIKYAALDCLDRAASKAASKAASPAMAPGASSFLPEAAWSPRLKASKTSTHVPYSTSRYATNDENGASRGMCTVSVVSCADVMEAVGSDLYTCGGGCSLHRIVSGFAPSSGARGPQRGDRGDIGDIGDRGLVGSPIELRGLRGEAASAAARSANCCRSCCAAENATASSPFTSRDSDETHSTAKSSSSSYSSATDTALARPPRSVGVVVASQALPMPPSMPSPTSTKARRPAWTRACSASVKSTAPVMCAAQYLPLRRSARRTRPPVTVEAKSSEEAPSASQASSCRQRRSRMSYSRFAMMQSTPLANADAKGAIAGEWSACDVPRTRRGAGGASPRSTQACRTFATTAETAP